MIPPDLLLHAYRTAVFPMAMENGDIQWFSPDPRAIIPLEDFKVPHGLRRTLKRGVFEIRINHSFEEVMNACAQRDETWINEEIIASYVALHRLGHAHSVEAWQDGALAGGLYGVSQGGAFCGESMFHRVTDASKVGLLGLVELLRDAYADQRLVDVQWETDHLASLGVVSVPRIAYLRALREALTVPLPAPWQ